jgi:hypothetical protein
MKFYDFFKLFIAVHLTKGKDYLNIDSFKRFLRRHYKEDPDITSKLNNALTRLVSSKFVKYDFDSNNILFTNKEGILKLVDKTKYNLEYIYKVASSYDDYCIEETARAYDMMIEPEAISQYNREMDRKIAEEISGHIRFGGR